MSISFIAACEAVPLRCALNNAIWGANSAMRRIASAQSPFRCTQPKLVAHRKPTPERAPPHFGESETPKANFWLHTRVTFGASWNPLRIPPLQWGAVLPAIHLIIPHVSRFSLNSLLQATSTSALLAGPWKTGLPFQHASATMSVQKCPSDALPSTGRRLVSPLCGERSHHNE